MTTTNPPSLHELLKGKLLALDRGALCELRLQIESLERAKRLRDDIREPLIAGDIASFFFPKEKEDNHEHS